MDYKVSSPPITAQESTFGGGRKIINSCVISSEVTVISGTGKIKGVSINLGLEKTFGLHDTVLETG